MRNYPPYLFVFLWTLFALLAAPAAHAQDDTDLGEAAQPIQEMRAIKNKTVVFVFDVSGSMKADGNLRRAREATVRILRDGLNTGDRAALFTFGAGYQKVFDKTIADNDDKSALIGQVPTETGTGAGTNIRRPHHESLKILDAGLPREGVVVLLTDSFNDEPKPADPTYPDYLRYYTPGGRLAKYPNTPENRDYERLLAKLNASGKFHQYGIGVGIGADGRPNERLPQAAPPPVEETPAAPVVTRDPPPAPGPSIPWLWLALGAGVLIAGTVAVLPLLRTSALRITGGPSGAKDFQIKNGQEVRLGGSGAATSFDAYPLPASAKDPVAVIRARGGRLTLSPFPAPAGGNQTAAPRVYHNGQILERDEPLAFGDEVRVSVPDAATGASKEVRLKFDDPQKTF